MDGNRKIEISNEICECDTESWLRSVVSKHFPFVFKDEFVGLNYNETARLIRSLGWGEDYADLLDEANWTLNTIQGNGRGYEKSY